MSRTRWIASVVVALLLLAPAFAFQGKDKKKPADAKSINDKKGEVTQTVDGAPAKTSLSLKFCLDVEGWFDKDGLNITGLNGEGPAGHLKGADDSEASLEPGDIILEIDGKKVNSPKDYADALNGAAAPAKVKIKVKDVNSGDNQEFFATLSKRDV